MDIVIDTIDQSIKSCNYERFAELIDLPDMCNIFLHAMQTRRSIFIPFIYKDLLSVKVILIYEQVFAKIFANTNMYKTVLFEITAGCYSKFTSNINFIVEEIYNCVHHGYLNNFGVLYNEYLHGNINNLDKIHFIIYLCTVFHHRVLLLNYSIIDEVKELISHEDSITNKRLRISINRYIREVYDISTYKKEYATVSKKFVDTKFRDKDGTLFYLYQINQGS